MREELFSCPRPVPPRIVCIPPPLTFSGVGPLWCHPPHPVRSLTFSRHWFFSISINACVSLSWVEMKSFLHPESPSSCHTNVPHFITKIFEINSVYSLPPIVICFLPPTFHWNYTCQCYPTSLLLLVNFYCAWPLLHWMWLSNSLLQIVSRGVVSVITWSPLLLSLLILSSPLPASLPLLYHTVFPRGPDSALFPFYSALSPWMASSIPMASVTIYMLRTFTFVFLALTSALSSKSLYLSAYWHFQMRDFQAPQPQNIQN